MGRKYPHEPGYHRSAPETSLFAAVEVADRARTVRGRVLRAFREVGDFTAHELARYLGEDHLTVFPRISELRAQGLVEDSGERRVNRHSGKRAAVWRAVREDEDD